MITINVNILTIITIITNIITILTIVKTGNCNSQNHHHGNSKPTSGTSYAYEECVPLPEFEALPFGKPYPFAQPDCM